MVSAILTSPPHSSTVSNFNSTSSTIDRAMAEDGSKYSESVSPQVMDDMPISLSARAIPLAKDPYVTPTSTLADPSGPVDAELMDQLDDMRQVLQNTITRTNNQLQGLKKSQQQDKAETPEQLQKVIGSYESLYKQVLASELVHWQVFFRQLTDSEAKGVAFVSFRNLLLDVVSVTSVWEADHLYFPELSELSAKMQTALEQHEIERAKHAHEKLEIQLDLDDELEGLDIMRLSRGVDAQEAVLEARFECISDVTALLFASVGEHAEIKPGSPYYNKLIILQGLIDDQIVAFHFIMKRETEEKARTVRDRLIGWLQIESSIDSALIKLPNGLGDKISKLRADLLSERREHPQGAYSPALDLYVKGRDSISEVC